jgi:hypothetical protein
LKLNKNTFVWTEAVQIAALETIFLRRT